MTIKDLLQSANASEVESLYRKQLELPSSQIEGRVCKLRDFLNRIPAMKSTSSDWLGLAAKGHWDYEVGLYSKEELYKKYNPNSPLFDIADAYSLSLREAEVLCKDDLLFTFHLITDFPWDVVLGAEVDPENIDQCGSVYAACDIVCAMTFYGFTEDEIKANIAAEEERINRAEHRHLDIPAPVPSPEERKKEAESAIQAYLYTKIAEYNEVHRYMRRHECIL